MSVLLFAYTYNICYSTTKLAIILHTHKIYDGFYSISTSKPKGGTALSLQAVKQTDEGVELTCTHIHVKQLALAVEEFIGREGVHVKVTLYG